MGRTVLSSVSDKSFISDEELIEFLTFCQDQSKIDSPMLDMTSYERHAFFASLPEFTQAQCCSYHLGILLFLSGFRTAEMYFKRKIDLEALAKIK